MNTVNTRTGRAGIGGTGADAGTAGITPPPPDPESSWTGLNRVLEQRRMSVADAARATGVPKADLVKLVRGEADGIRFTTLAAVCTGLDCTPAQLLTDNPRTTQHAGVPVRRPVHTPSQPAPSGTRWLVRAWAYRSVQGARVSMLVSAAAATAFLLGMVSTVNPVDFLVYRYSSADAWAGVNIYQVNTHGPMLGDDGLPFTYTPMAALALLITAIGSPLAAFLGWSVATAALSVAVLYRLMPVSWRERPLPVGLLTLWGLCNIITASHLIFGQINVFLMVLVLFDLTRGVPARENPGARSSRWVLPVGVLTGIAAAIKLTPALFIVHLWVTGQYRAARTSTLTAAGATFIGFTIYPQLSWDFFTATLWSLSDRVSLNGFFATSGNQSIHGALAAVGPWTSHLALALTGVIVLAGLAAAATAHRSGRIWEAALIIGLTACLPMPAVEPGGGQQDQA